MIYFSKKFWIALSLLRDLYLSSVLFVCNITTLSSRCSAILVVNSKACKCLNELQSFFEYDLLCWLSIQLRLQLFSRAELAQGGSTKTELARQQQNCKLKGGTNESQPKQSDEGWRQMRANQNKVMKGRQIRANQNKVNSGFF